MATNAWSFVFWKADREWGSFLTSEYPTGRSGVPGAGWNDVPIGSPQGRNTWLWWSLALSTSNGPKGMSICVLESWPWVVLVFDLRISNWAFRSTRCGGDWRHDRVPTERKYMTLMVSSRIHFQWPQAKSSQWQSKKYGDDTGKIYAQTTPSQRQENAKLFLIIHMCGTLRCIKFNPVILITNTNKISKNTDHIFSCAPSVS